MIIEISFLIETDDFQMASILEAAQQTADSLKDNLDAVGISVDVDEDEVSVCRQPLSNP